MKRKVSLWHRNGRGGSARRLLMLGLVTTFAGFAATSVQAQEGPRAEAGSGGFSITSADRSFRLRLRGLVQVDGRVYTNSDAPDADTGWLLRRVRPSFEGSFGERIGFRIMPEFAGGGSLIDAYIDTRLGSGVTLRAGKFKQPLGLERLQSGNELRLVERGLVTDLVGNRDIGLQLSGGSAAFSWQAGLFNGVNDGRSADAEDDGSQEFIARIFSEPLSRENGRAVLGIGIAASYGRREGSTSLPLLTSYRSPGQKAVFQYRSGAEGTFSDGSRTRITPQFYWYSGPFGVLGEWVRVSQDVRRAGTGFDRSATLDQEAWNLTAEWVVTGQSAGYTDPAGAGVVQLTARIGELRIDPETFANGSESFANPANAVSRAKTWALGVNWFPIAGLKASVAYHQTAFTAGAAGGNDRQDEQVLFLRLQHRF
jgi:phosphate-selective porin OprO and OprP